MEATVTTHNLETNAITVRLMSDAELAERQAGQDTAITQMQAEAAKAADKAALLAKLGITEDEAKLLLS